MNINNMTMYELAELNSRIVKRIKHLRDLESMRLSNTFDVGDIVSFDARSRGKKTGVITKINRKTVKIDVEGALWTVSLPLVKMEMSLKEVKIKTEMSLKQA